MLSSRYCTQASGTAAMERMFRRVRTACLDSKGAPSTRTFQVHPSTRRACRLQRMRPCRSHTPCLCHTAPQLDRRNLFGSFQRRNFVQAPNTCKAVSAHPAFATSRRSSSRPWKCRCRFERRRYRACERQALRRSTREREQTRNKERERGTSTWRNARMRIASSQRIVPNLRQFAEVRDATPRNRHCGRREARQRTIRERNTQSGVSSSAC